MKRNGTSNVSGSSPARAFVIRTFEGGRAFTFLAAPINRCFKELNVRVLPLFRVFRPLFGAYTRLDKLIPGLFQYVSVHFVYLTMYDRLLNYIIRMSQYTVLI